MKFKIILITLILSATACNKSKPLDDVDPETLKPTGGEVNRPGYSFESELADDECRFVSDMLSLHYSDGGVIFSREDADASTTIYRAVSIATGDCAELHLSATSPRLIVNDEEIPIKSATIERENESGAWINILTPDYRHIVFVVTDL